MRVFPRLAAAMLAAVIAGPALGDPGDPRALIEIPAGSFVKYELDEETGRMEVDRFLSTPVAYPANYGIITGTREEDGDPLDVLVYTRAPVHPGALIRVRPIGVLRMRDGGQGDNKILAVPTSAVDPTYDAIRGIDDLPEMDRQRLVTFFAIYKLLPEGGRQPELDGFAGADTAQALIEQAQAREAAR